MSGLLQSAVKRQAHFAAVSVTAVIITRLLYTSGFVKHFDTAFYNVSGILVTADVWERVKDKFTFIEKRNVTVKGYGKAIEACVAGCKPVPGI
jgi:hypothetical protein